MMTRAYSFFCFVWLGTTLIGCSLILDPTKCSSDSDCEDGVCTSGVCVVTTSTPADMTLEADAEVDAQLETDATVPMTDAMLADALVQTDMEIPDLDESLPDLPPSCELTASESLTSASDVRLTLTVTDPDSDVAGLEVRLNDTTLALAEDGTYQGVFLLSEGTTVFELNAETNGQTCTATATVVSDRTPPRLEANQPANDSVTKSGTGRVFVAAQVVEPHFAPDITIFVNSQPAEPVAPVEWNDQSYLFELQLERGLHSVEVLIRDLLGNQTPSPVGRDCSVDSCLHKFTVDVDSLPPQIEFDELSTTTTNRIPGRSIRLQGTVLDDDMPLSMAFMTVTIRPDGAASRTFGLQANPAGRFDQSVDVLLEQSNSAQVEVCATDIAGNEGCAELSVEKQLPCVSIESPTDGVYVSSSSTRISGTICDGVDRLEFRRNGESQSFIAVSGASTFNSNILLPENGPHELRVIAYNDVLLETAEDTVTISRDTTNPELAFTRPLQEQGENAVCTQSTLETCVTVGDEESGIESLELGGITIPSNQIGTTVCRTIEVNRGENIALSAQARNGSGLITTRTITLDVDDVAPLVSFTQPQSNRPNPWVRTEAGLVTIAGTVDSGVCATQRFLVNGSPLNIQQNNTFSVILPFAEGQHNLQYEITDLAGNTRTNSLPFRVDDTAPTIEINGVVSGQHLATTNAELSVLITDTGSGVDQGSLTVNGVSATLTPSGGNRYRAEIAMPLSEGTNTINVSGSDAVGNTANASVNVIRDTTAPIITVLSPTANQSISVPAIVRGSVSDGETGVGIDKIFVNDVEAIIDHNTGAWYATNVAVDPTDRIIEILGTDLLGNESIPTQTPVVMPNYAKYSNLESGIPGIASLPSALHSADFNSDGRIDILEISSQENQPSRCLFQLEDGRFESRSAEECGLSDVSGHLCSKVADFDGDNRLDLVYFSDTNSEILFGGANGSFISDGINLVVDPTVTDCEVADIDRDGRLDIIVLADDTVYVLFADDTLDFELDDPVPLGLSPLNEYTHLRAVDLDDNGVTDLVAWHDGGLTVLQGLFNNTFSEVVVDNELPHTGQDERSVVIMDADDDGVFELVLLGQTTKLFKRTSNANEPLTMVKQSSAPNTFANQFVGERADINNDGRDDFVALGAFGMKIIANFGSELSQIDETPLGLSSVGNVRLSNVVDLDGDGDEDWIFGTTTGLEIWKNNLVQREPGYLYFTVDVNRHTLGEEVFRPADTRGSHLFVEYIDQATLDASGQILSVNPSRVLLPRKNVPTVVSLGAAPGAHLSVRFTDKGTPGRSLRTVERIPAGTVVPVYSRE